MMALKELISFKRVLMLMLLVHVCAKSDVAVLVIAIVNCCVGKKYGRIDSTDKLYMCVCMAL